METCRNAWCNAHARLHYGGGLAAGAMASMATVQLKNVKKIYPFVSGDEKMNQKEKSDEAKDK